MRSFAFGGMGKVFAALALLTGLGVASLPMSGPAPAQPSAPASHMDVRLDAETRTPGPGDTVRVAFRMKAEPGWHGYWLNPGESGAAPNVRWSLPDGASASALRHPAPKTLAVAGLVSYVHEGSYALLADISLPASATKGTKLPVTAALDYLVCSDEACVPESKTLALELTVGDGRVAPADKTRFDSMAARLPRAVAAPAQVSVDQGTIQVAIAPLPGVRPASAQLFPTSPDMFEAGAPQSIEVHAGRLVFSAPTSLIEAPERFEGVVGTTDAGGAPAYAIVAEGVPAAEMRALAGAVEPRPSAVASAPDASTTERFEQSLSTAAPVIAVAPPARVAGVSLVVAFMGALIGGLILNLMPCVFPILSLKALSIARSGSTEAAAKREAIAYSAGAILVCVALGVGLLALRAAGSQVGWAFQLQDPRVILILLLLALVIGLNLTGLFELRGFGFGQKLAAKQGVAGAFWTGTLAAFVATPCTGPFMGAALGAALLLPPLGALLVFAGLGLGLALPFLLIGFVPAIRTRLPRPGAWMDGFRRLLALPMFATAIGLAWVLGRQTGVEGMTLGLAAGVAVAVGLWWLGRRQAIGAARPWIPAGLGVAALAVALILLPQPQAGAAPMRSAGGPIEPFSEERLAALRAENLPVFVDFTADWCLICKVNDKLAIDTDRTRAAFRKAGVVTLVGDWTNGDPAITEFLASHGRNSIPYYLFYGPGRPVVELPQILTPALLETTVASSRVRGVR